MSNEAVSVVDFHGEVHTFGSAEALIAEAESIVESSGYFTPNQQALIRACFRYRATHSMSERLGTIAWNFSDGAESSRIPPTPFDDEIQGLTSAFDAKHEAYLAAEADFNEAADELNSLHGGGGLVLHGAKGLVHIGGGSRMGGFVNRSKGSVKQIERATDRTYEALRTLERAEEDRQTARRALTAKEQERSAWRSRGRR